MGTEENAGNHFLLFPAMLFTHPNENSCLLVRSTFILLSANAFNLDQSKILSFDKELNVVEMVISVFDRAENIFGKGENAGILNCSSMQPYTWLSFHIGTHSVSQSVPNSVSQSVTHSLTHS